jgi:hypothetical protein
LESRVSSPLRFFAHFHPESLDIMVRIRFHQLLNALLFIAVFQLGIASGQIIPPPGESRSICLQSWMGTFVCAENGGGGLLTVNRPAAKSWETLTLRRVDQERVTLVAANGQFVCAENGGNSLVVANRRDAGSWETFRISITSNGCLCFRTSGGKYLCADRSGIVMANRDSPGVWEQFRAVTPEKADGEVCRVDVNVYKIGTAPFWHTGTVIAGREFYFDTNNRVREVSPKGMKLNFHRQMTRFVPGNIEHANVSLDAVRSRWDGSRYDVASHNCNWFTNELLAELGAAGLDDEYLQASGIAQIAKNVPGEATAQEILVKWPVDDKRLDEAAMEDLRRLTHVPEDLVTEIKGLGGSISTEWKRLLH